MQDVMNPCFDDEIWHSLRFRQQHPNCPRRIHPFLSTSSTCLMKVENFARTNNLPLKRPVNWGDISPCLSSKILRSNRFHHAIDPFICFNGKGYVNGLLFMRRPVRRNLKCVCMEEITRKDWLFLRHLCSLSRWFMAENLVHELVLRGFPAIKLHCRVVVWSWGWVI